MVATIRPAREFRFGMELEAIAGPERFPLGSRGTDHGGRVWEYRTRPVTLRDWAAARPELERFWGQVRVDPRGNPPTGLHVHVEVPEEVRTDQVLLKRFFARLARLWEKVEAGLVGRYRSREREQWTARWDESHRETLAAAIRAGNLATDRYRSLNFASFGEHGTVEFRLWDATGSLEEAEERVALCLALVWVAAAGCGRRTAHVPVAPEIREAVTVGRALLAEMRRSALRRGQENTADGLSQSP
ncbi:MAG: hypothetical protein AB1816_00450 [Bacillota bacterium]